MKKNDFIKWGEFVFGVLLEFDKRLNLSSDYDIKILVIFKKIKTPNQYDAEYNLRVQGFLSERLGNIFYDKHFSRRYEMDIVDAQ